MPIAIKIEQKDTGVQRLLQRLEKRLADMSPVFGTIGEIVHGSIQENFEKGGRPTRWKELSPVTIAQREKQGKWPGRILSRLGVAGGLMGSISYRAFKDRVEISARKIYAPVHQFGARKGEFGTVEARIKQHVRRITQVFGRPIEPKEITVRAHTRKMAIPWGDIPARPFMVVQTEDWTEIKETALDFLTAVRG